MTNQELPRHKSFINILGEKYHRLLVVSYAGKRRVHEWKCLCDCGNYVNVRGTSLRFGSTKSCGCLNDETRKTVHVTHGLGGTPAYKTWDSMIQRCTNENKKAYAHYGARGITVCDRWRTFENFLSDMGERPEGMSLDRIDNDKGYSPENCRWADIVTQRRNTRRNRYIMVDGEPKTIAEMAIIDGLSYSGAHKRYSKHSLSYEEAHK